MAVDEAFPAIRRAVRSWLRAHSADGRVCVALSGGADSLALTAAAAQEAEDVVALIIDHGLQEGSDAVATGAAEQATRLGCSDAHVIAVHVDGPGGMEAAARRARYGALDTARSGRPVLFAHTLDDQAETVLLGLGRGSGARSIRGMSAWSQPWGRPLLGIRRAQTRAACTALRLEPHDDPHNRDPRFARVRVRREVLPLLEEVLGGGAAAALARTAAQLREDDAVLVGLAGDLLERARVRQDGAPAGCELDVRVLAAEAPAVRRRVLRTWLHDHGAQALTDARLRQVDALIGRWRGQGGVALGGGGPGVRVVALRRHGRLTVVRETGAPDKEWSEVRVRG